MNVNELKRQFTDLLDAYNQSETANIYERSGHIAEDLAELRKEIAQRRESFEHALVESPHVFDENCQCDNCRNAGRFMDGFLREDES